jgi:hypothetical protein
MRSDFRGMFQRHVVIAAALVLVALAALTLVLVPGISSLRALEAGPCARATILACVRTPVATARDAKRLLALPQTVSRPSLGGSPKPRWPTVRPASIEPYPGDAHWVMRTGLHTEQKRRTVGVPLLPDVLKPERWHSRPAHATVAAHGEPAVEKESAPTRQTGVGENRTTAGIVAGDAGSTEFAIAREIATALARGRRMGQVARRLCKSCRWSETGEFKPLPTC